MKEYDFLEFCSFLQKKGKIKVKITDTLNLRGYIPHIPPLIKEKKYKESLYIGKLLPCTVYIDFILNIKFLDEGLITMNNLNDVCEIHIQQKGSSIAYIVDGSEESNIFLATKTFIVTKKYFSDKEIFEKGKKMINKWLYNKPKTRIKKNI